MAVVFITKKLEEEINKKFKHESVEIFSLLLSLEDHPHKGQNIGLVSNIMVKEIKYKSLRFYFITDGYKIKVLKGEELKDLFIKFVRMSDKDSQQVTIEEIKSVLRNLGTDGF